LATPIAEDFSAIRARLADIRAVERTWLQPPEAEEPAPPAQAGPGDFYAWLMAGGIWAQGR